MRTLKGTLIVLVLLVGALAMLAVGCNTDDDPIAKTGSVSVGFGSGAKADATVEVNVTFSQLAMRNLSGDPSVTLIDGSETIDLAGDMLDGFDVPEGRYHCLAITVTDAEVVEGENHCSFGALLSTLSNAFDEVCLGGDGFLVVEDGSYTVLVDAGFQAGCPVDGGAPSFSFTGVPSLQLR